MRLRYSAPAFVILLAGSSAFAQVGNVDDTVSATSQIEQDLSLTVLVGNVDCGIVSVDVPTACNAAATPATVKVVANSNWALSIEDLGGAAGQAVSLGNAAMRFGHFVLNLAVDLPTGGPTLTTGTNVTISEAGIRTGTMAEALDFTDEWGQYEGEFLLTLTATN